MMSGSAPDLTVLFVRLRDGDRGALGEIVDALHTELRLLARRRMRAEAHHHTLQPTALVHEAYLRLVRGPLSINDRHHFFAIAAKAMRHVLVDHARQKRSDKRGGVRERVTLELVPGEDAIDFVKILAIDQGLSRLAELDPQAADIVELRYFGGHTDEQVCDILNAKLPTVRRHFVFGRAFLKTHLAPIGHA